MDPDAAAWRAYVSMCRDNGIKPDPLVALHVSIADFLEIPDDMPLLPAVEAAIYTQTDLADPASVAYTKQVAHAAGRGKLMPEAKTKAPQRP